MHIKAIRRTHTPGTNALWRCVIVLIALFGAGCATQSDTQPAPIHLAGRVDPHRPLQTAATRLRVDSVARIRRQDSFGNLALVRSVDAYCGYQDDQVEVLCLNVAHAFNVDDAQKLRDLTRPGVTAQVSDVDTASTLHRQSQSQGVTLGDPTVVVAPFVDCHGACASRIHVVRAP